MNLYHALTLEKSWIPSIDGVAVEAYLNYVVNDDYSKLYTFLDKDEKIIALLNPTDILVPSKSGPGFFLVTDYSCDRTVIIELVNGMSPTIR